jgi:hypothetical protein
MPAVARSSAVQLDMAGYGRWTDNRFDTSQIGGAVRVAQPRQHLFDRGEFPTNAETEHTAEAAHLPLRHVVVRMRFQPGVVDMLDDGLFLQPKPSDYAP